MLLPGPVPHRFSTRSHWPSLGQRVDLLSSLGQGPDLLPCLAQRLELLPALAQRRRRRRCCCRRSLLPVDLLHPLARGFVPSFIFQGDDKYKTYID